MISALSLRKSCCPRILLFCGALFFFSIAATATAARPGEVTHVIVVWLQRPGNLNDRNVLTRAARTLRRGRGVTNFRIGPILPPNVRPNETPGDLAIVLTFRNERMLRRFENDQRQQDVLERALAPLVRRRVAYDFLNE